MKISDIKEKLELTDIVACDDTEITGAYVSDLLSDVVGNAQEGDVLVTIQVHKNLIAVAGLVGLGAVIITHGRVPEEEVCAVARENNIPVLGSQESSFTVAGKLYEAGIRST
jgi:predicted transcriptional regulator